MEAARPAARPAADPIAVHMAQAAACARQGAFAGTCHHLEAALRLGERSARVYYNLGVAYGRLGRRDRALAAYRLALVEDPAHRGAHTNLGQAWLASGSVGAPAGGAVAALRRAVWLAPDDVRARTNLAAALSGLPDGAAMAGRGLRDAAALAPSDGGVWFQLGQVGQVGAAPPAEAGAWFRRALRCGDAPPRAWYGLGVAEQQQGRADRAALCYGHALAADPGDLDALANRMIALQEEGCLDGALAEAGRLLRHRPDDAGALYLRGWTALLRGELALGYPGYDVRWRRPAPDLRQHRFPAPLWDGRPLAGGRLLLWGEFGVGDEILMAGLLGDALARCADVVLETDPRFVSLFQRSWPGVTVVARTDPPDPRTREPGIVAQSSLMRLPILLRPDRASFPDHGGYLVPDPERVRRRRADFAALGTGGGPVVGLAWTSGNPRTGGRKSMSLERWAPVLRVPGVRFVSLQYDATGEAVAAARSAGWTGLWPNPNPGLRDDMEDLAAQVAALDAVVSIAGINAHMAGALGRPGLVLLPHTPLWFWFDRGERCPWYPALHLVRQGADGDWQAPIAALAAALARLLPA